MNIIRKDKRGRKPKKMLKIRFTFNGAGRYKGKFSLAVYDSVTRKRSYAFASDIFRALPMTLSAENFDSKKQQFIGNGIHNKICNKIIQQAIVTMSDITKHYTTASEILEQYKLNTYSPSPWEKDNEVIPQGEKGIPTLLEWLTKLTEEKKKTNSTNYQLYQTLTNKLRGKDDKHKCWYTIIPQNRNNVLLYTIRLDYLKQEDIQAFSDWINDELNGKGYKNLMTTFKAAYRTARDRFGLKELIFNVKNPKTDNEIELSTTKDDSLTQEQISVLETADFTGLTAKPFGGISFDLTRDILLFQYYSMSRPTDTLLFKHSKSNSRKVKSHTIKLPEGELRYIPFKKRGYSNKKQQAVSILSLIHI